MIQKEVADRLAASAGGREYGPISILTAVLGRIERVATVPPGCFWPAPKVVSAVVSITTRPDHGVEHPERFADFVGELFRTRRKQVGATLNRMKIAAPVGLDGSRRPESMSPEELLRLFRDVGCPEVRPGVKSQADPRG